MSCLFCGWIRIISLLEVTRFDDMEVSTFEVLGTDEDGANMVVFDQRLDLGIYCGAGEAHHEQLPHLPIKKRLAGKR